MAVLFKTKSRTRNLCDSCSLCIPECESLGIGFGEGVGNDNVIECRSYYCPVNKVPKWVETIEIEIKK